MVGIGIGWLTNGRRTTNVARRLVATSPTATWHLEFGLAKGRGEDGQYSLTLDGDNVVCCHRQAGRIAVVAGFMDGCGG
jgi:hypothetical protein